MKKRYIIAMFSLIIVLATTLSVSFAWWINGTKAPKDIKFKSAIVSSTMTFYTGNDYDLDGVFDYDAEGAFTQQTQIKMENEIKEIPITINNFMPTEVYTYKMHVENNGDVDGYVVALYNMDLVYSDERFAEFIKCLSITYVWTETNQETNETTIHNQKCYLGHLGDRGWRIFGGSENEKIGLTEGANAKDFIFKIEFETEAALNKQRIGIINYQELQNYSMENVEMFYFVLSSVKYENK